MLALLKGEKVTSWRDKIFYEYFWENDFPQTPTTFGVRTDKYKYIRYQGIWDTNEFYDLENDPFEMNNIIDNPKYQLIIKDMNRSLFEWLEKTGGMKIPLKNLPNFRERDHRNQNVY